MPPLILFLLLCVHLCPCQLWEEEPSYQNPVEDSNRPDPGVLALPDGSGYVVVTTTGGEDNAFAIMSSVDLVHWKKEGYVFPNGSWPVWAVGSMWAPELHYVNGQYHVYYSAKSNTNFRFCLGVARSSSPLGPFLDIGHPLLENPDLGVIDVHWFRDPLTSVPYIVWKTDDNAVGRTARIFIQEVEEDGVSFPPGGHIYQVLQADRVEERNVVEGPWIIYRSPYYYLIYSGNGYGSPRYFTGVARSVNVTGPYVKQRKEDGSFLQTDLAKYERGENCTLVGPGHGSVVRVGDQDWFLYHAWRWNQVFAPPGRTLNLDLIHWNQETGWPYIGHPSTSSVPAPRMVNTEIAMGGISDPEIVIEII